jgi:hypothetical protein
LFFAYASCDRSVGKAKQNDLENRGYAFEHGNLILSKSAFHDKFEGFWLGQCIANWTGLVTEMDKIGNIGDIQTGRFYTRED